MEHTVTRLAICSVWIVNVHETLVTVPVDVLMGMKLQILDAKVRLNYTLWQTSA